MSRDWLLYLEDLIDSAEKIGSFLQGRSFETFSSNEMHFDAVLFNLEAISEAVKKLPEEAKSSATPTGGMVLTTYGVQSIMLL